MIRYFVGMLVLGGLTFVSATEVASKAQESSLFNRQNLNGWREPRGTWFVCGEVGLDPADSRAFQTKSGTGILINTLAAKTVDLVTEEEFGDCHLQLEFCVAKGSNSGVYFQGRYEVQVMDSHGKPSVNAHDCGAIYERWDDSKKSGYEGHAPRVNACKAPGEWQSFEMVFRAPRFDSNGTKTQNAKFLKILQNGQVLHENVELTGPTRGGKGEEAALGPIRLQGDHGPVAYRNLKISKLSLP